MSHGAIGMPCCAQLRKQIQHLIAVGELAPDVRLPPAQRLADNLDINCKTVLHVHREFEREGLVEFRKGVSTFVAADVAHFRHGPDYMAFLHQLDAAVGTALQADLTPERIANLALTHAGATQVRMVERADRPVSTGQPADGTCTSHFSGQAEAFLGSGHPTGGVVDEV